MTRTENFEQVEVSSSEELRAWLEEHHAQDASIWLVTWKKSAGARYVSRDEVLDELIAFGWIDGIRRKLDDNRTMQLISPRQERAWTRTYKDRAARLEAEGRMMPPGRAAITRSRMAGEWETSDSVDALEIPPDLRAALVGHDGALAFFEASAPSYRRNVLRWIAKAKRDETRARRIASTASSSARSTKIPHM